MQEVLKIFLCHSKEDKPKIRGLYRKLSMQGFDIWFDEEKLVPGQEWQLEIPKAVRESHIVIICLSTSSVTKEGYVQKEIKIALDAADEKPEGTIYLIPTRLEKCLVPERLQKWQWVDLFESDGFEKLLSSLKIRMISLGIHGISEKVKAQITINTIELYQDLMAAQSEIARRDGEYIVEAIEVYKVLISKGLFIEQIIYDMEHAIYIYPDETIFWQLLGDAYLRTNQLKEANKAYETAEIKLSKNSLRRKRGDS